MFAPSSPSPRPAATIQPPRAARRRVLGFGLSLSALAAATGWFSAPRHLPGASGDEFTVINGWVIPSHLLR